MPIRVIHRGILFTSYSSPVPTASGALQNLPKFLEHEAPVGGGAGGGGSWLGGLHTATLSSIELFFWRASCPFPRLSLCEPPGREGPVLTLPNTPANLQENPWVPATPEPGEPPDGAPGKA